MKKTHLVKFANYKDFIEVSKKDNKLEILSEVNNTFRTLSSTFFLLILLKVYDYFRIKWLISFEIQTYAFLLLLLILFLLSHKKQTNYIVNRIESYK